MPQDTIHSGSYDGMNATEDTGNVFNKLLDLESQAFSDRGNWCDGLAADSSFTSSLRSRTLALVERAAIEDEGSPLFK